MTDFSWFYPLTAIWLGVLTSISPCPLATNIAAIGYLGKMAGATTAAQLLTATAYTVGRMLAYLLVGWLIIGGLLSSPSLSVFLQKHLNQMLGPLLILAGLYLLGWLSAGIEFSAVGEKAQRHLPRWGLCGGAIVGFLFALSFCPVSAALFFGSLLPLALERKSTVMLPLLYGVGSAAPVIFLSVLLFLSEPLWRKAIESTRKMQVFLHPLTGVVFLAVGIYMSVVYIWMA